MELSILLLRKIIVLLSIVLMGFLSVRHGQLKSEHSSVLSRISFDWIVPCSLINSFITSYDDTVMKNFFLACGMVVLMILFFIGITLLLRRWLPLNPSEQGSLMFTNSASMALPMASALLGPENVIFCAPHMGVQNLFIFTLVPYIMNGKAEGGWRKVFLNRNLIAILIGILLFFTRCPVPELLHDVIATVGGTISPISMFMIGILMGGVNFGELFREKKLYLVCLLRLILYPLAIILLIRITGVLEHFPYAGTALMVLIMCISSPVATLITQMSDLYRSHEEAQEASSINVITTLLCSITMPLMVLLYQVICL